MMISFDRKHHDLMNKFRGHNFENARNWFNEIEPFVFKYNAYCLDWFEEKRVEIKWNDFDDFRLELRFGPSIWLVGRVSLTVDDDYRVDEYEIGEIETREDLMRFIEWNKKLCKRGGTAIKEITCLHEHLFDYFDVKGF